MAERSFAIAYQRLQCRNQRIGIARRDQHAGHPVLDHELGRARPRRNKSGPRRHRLDQRQPKTFVPRGEGIDQ